MQNDNQMERVYAGFFVRLAAYVVDMLIVGLALLSVRIPRLVLLLADPDNVMVKKFIFNYSVLDIVIYVLTILYFILMTYYTGSTLGKKLFQLKVVSAQNQKLTLFEVVYRETIGRFLSSVILNLGYLMIVIDGEKRGVHDMLSDTRVIYYHEKKVYTHSATVYRDMNSRNTYNGNGQNNSSGNVGGNFDTTVGDNGIRPSDNQAKDDNLFSQNIELGKNKNPEYVSPLDKAQEETSDNSQARFGRALEHDMNQNKTTLKNLGSNYFTDDEEVTESDNDDYSKGIDVQKPESKKDNLNENSDASNTNE